MSYQTDRSLFGVINIHKPCHCTSHDVVAQVRKKLGFKKVGHSGTLDPLAQGVLPVFVGQATRLIEYMPDDKRYRAKITFGWSTLTWDAEGELLHPKPAETLTAARVETLLKEFEGTIDQTVPPHAAVHVKGKKLYEYTRRGETVELPVRKATIHSICLESFEDEGQPHPVAVVSIHCASGTYVRSIANALGQLTGFGAYLSDLVRTAHGRFLIETSVPLETFVSSPNPEEYLQNPADFIDIPQYPLTEDAAQKIRHGMKLQPTDIEWEVKNNRLYLLLYHGLPLSIVQGEQKGRLKPLKVFL